MKVLKAVEIVVVVIIILFVVIGMLLPSNAHVERSITIAVPAEQVFPHVLDFRQWHAWSPWAERDPNMKLTPEGPPTGVGAKMIWSSEHEKVGSGSQETTDVQPNRLVRTHLDFGDHGEADAFLKLEPSSDGCTVTWGFDSNLGMNPIGRYFGLMFGKMIGPDYEKGLAKLKSVAENTNP